MTASDDLTPAGLELGAGLNLSLGRLATALEMQQQKAQRLGQALHQVTIGPGLIPIAASAGTLAQDPMFGPNTGFFWSVRRLTAWGFSAGTVQVFMNSTNGELLPSFAQAGSLTFGRGELLLQPNDNLYFVASGITLAAGFAGVQIQGVADNGELWILPDYLL
jgi:hypothetical protein